ncbi:molybdopterin molybdotransferase MoeA [Psychrilyobacter atlanticus]|uniref:molybdopterin molybdotransferase MoeA n=1 Tax=Psychrilyobacter atlanticus TaxID=271091 RepID=UPI0004202016|nr:molybdopterin molybdotransferase MoeA [Psychrilyobacter atlanticus]
MNFLKVTDIDEIEELILKKIPSLKGKKETCKLEESLGRVLCENIVASVNVPEFNRSTVDGYAIKSKESLGASQGIPAFFTIKGEVLMGENTSKKLESGEAIYVPTGAMIPTGADSMIMIEYCEILEDTLLVHKPVSSFENIMLMGEDVKEDDVILKKGSTITPENIGALASLGIYDLPVFKKFKFSIISTGDEIIGEDEEYKMGKIRDVNSYTLSLAIQKFGVVVEKKIVKDNFDTILEEVKKSTEKSDIVLISGGSSAGNYDYTSKVISLLDEGEVFIHGISIKPGKPTIIGKSNDKLIFGLPGHPISSMVVFNIVVKKLIENLYFCEDKDDYYYGTLSHNLHSTPGRTTYQMINKTIENDDIVINPIFGKSGMTTLMTKSNGYIILESNIEGLEKGSRVKVYRF